MSEVKYSVFISGPMTGFPLYNFPAFAAAERTLRERGLTVSYNPARDDLQRFGLSIFDEEWMQKHFSYEEALARCLDEVGKADFIALLPGWELSNGSKRELCRALELKKGVILL